MWYGMPACRAMSIPLMSLREPTTTSIDADRYLRAIRSWKFANVRPPPDNITASLIGGLGVTRGMSGHHLGAALAKLRVLGVCTHVAAEIPAADALGRGSL